ncbi:MAG: hypothetical protein PHZ19_08185 [Candidatus Thermoplasmatota archaeon]|nr:hypothetical protein [Candidatus Thermoplasmatota archaeon]
MAQAQATQKQPEAPTPPPPAKPKMVRFVFHNLKDRDSKDNVLPVELTYNGERHILYSGQEYEKPAELVEWLKSRAYPVYDYVPNPDDPKGSKICAKVGEEPRFAIHVMD